MRTTIDLDPRAHRLAKMLAAKCDVSLGAFVSELILDTYDPKTVGEVEVNEVGWPVISVGRPISDEEVQSLIEEQ